MTASGSLSVHRGNACVTRLYGMDFLVFIVIITANKHLAVINK